MSVHLPRLAVVLILFCILISCNTPSKQQFAWPEINRETKPWTRWWWQGSGVTKARITEELESFKRVGLGGVEITPIYGVYGHEEKFIEYLSPRWMEMLEHTLKEAERLGLGVDMATGTGWPFGGPWVSAEDACRNMNYKVYTVNEGEMVNEAIRFHQEPFVRSVGMQVYETVGMYRVEGQATGGSIKEPLIRKDKEPLTINDLIEPVSANENLQALALDQVKFAKELSPVAVMAYSADGQTVDLLDKVDETGKLNWHAPSGRWTVYAVFPGWHGKMVERAAPGGEGNVIDHFSEKALVHYLAKFDSSLKNRDTKSLRAFFNDSYEVDDARGAADWTPSLFDEFKQRRGYDLRHHLPALFGKDEDEKNERVLCDYRETIGELIHDNFTSVWKTWANKKGQFIRNQAHGSPSNILDLYALVDIPEMEGTEVSRIKMASSAANVSGKKFTSSESATWLNEHFLSNLADIKHSVDRFLVSGVNHVFYHGTCYSPREDPWPGWLFYAAVHLNDRNPMWEDFTKLNEYITRCQSFLQASTPANDILLYLPIYDRYSSRGPEMIEHFDGVDKPFEGTAFKESLDWLLTRGFSFDYISDRQIRNLTVEGGKIRSSLVSCYKTILVPYSKYIPLETFTALMQLSKEGATVLIYKDFPAMCSGFKDYPARQSQYTDRIGELSFVSAGEVDEARFGKGRFLKGDDLTVLTKRAQVRREALTDLGLQFIKKGTDDGMLYLITNWTEERVEGWVRLSEKGKSAVLFDPMFGTFGVAKRRIDKNDLEVFLQMEKGETTILQLFDREIDGEPFPYDYPGAQIPIDGPWELSFIAGGPTLPEPITLDSLAFWTSLSNDELNNFSGTGKYSVTFKRPLAGLSARWNLDFGEVKETARIFLNGNHIATLIGPTYKIQLEDSLLEESNTLEIEVSNLMANRIAYLERQGAFWKKFYNVNFPARLAENRVDGIFNAAGWKPVASGLAGPVTMNEMTE